MVKYIHLYHSDFSFESRFDRSAGFLLSKQSRVYAVGACASGSHRSISRDNGVIKIIVSFSAARPKTIRAFLYFFQTSAILKKIGKTGRKNCYSIHSALQLLFIPVIRVFSSKPILIYEPHELEFAKTGNSLIMRWLNYTLERLFLRLIDKFIFVNRSIEALYKEVYTIDPSRSFVLENVDRLAEGFKRRDRESADLAFVYCGMCTEGRGLNQILALVKSKCIKHFTIFGNNPSFFNPDDLRLFELREYLLAYDLRAELGNFDVGICFIEPVSLSYKICLPNKIFQYFESGLFVVASNLVEFRKLRVFFPGLMLVDDLSTGVKLINNMRQTELRSLGKANIEALKIYKAGVEQKREQVYLSV